MMINMVGLPNINDPVQADPNDLPPPVAMVKNPASGKIERIYKNIENEPLIEKIKRLEEKLESLMGDYSVEADLENIREDKPILKSQMNKEEVRKGDIVLLKDLLESFGRLLKTEYGVIGYLVRSNSEDILKLYGVDSDEDYYYHLKTQGSTIRISSKLVEGAVAAGGGRRWLGESGLLLNNPAETPNNIKVADRVIDEIIASIKTKLIKLENVATSR